LRRGRVDDWLDAFRFRLDSFPRSQLLGRFTGAGVHYQPIPELGLNDGARAKGTRSRWREIERVIDDSPRKPGSSVDIGAGTGFFTRGLAEKGIPSIAIEPEPIAYRTTLLAIKRARLESRAGVLVLALSPENIALLPEVDVVIFLSLWHHFVRSHGLEAATELLESIWARTRGFLFFETGENEMPVEFGLPHMTPNATTWLQAFLTQHCDGGIVEHLGVHQAFDADGQTAAEPLRRPPTGLGHVTHPRGGWCMIAPGGSRLSRRGFGACLATPQAKRSSRPSSSIRSIAFGTS